jgi:cyclophilin family peptidyl-prolyl cis-trans isomerase
MSGSDRRVDLSPLLQEFRMSSLARATVVAAGLILCCTLALAQNDAPTATAADWEELIKERDDKLAQLQKIRTQLQKATDAAQAKQLEAEGTQLLEDIFSSLFPRMRASATDLLKGDSVSAETLTSIAELAYRTFQENKFAEAAALADGVLAKDPENKLALNVAGVCHFATQDFEGAAKMLSAAQEKGLLFDNLGGQYLESANNYVGYWKEEQARREKDASAPEKLPEVELDTTRGKIIIELFEDDAPNTVANFISLVESGFYDGTTFHRVLPAFMAQGGDPNTKPDGTGQAGTGGPGYTIKCEWDQPNSRRHFAGTLSMAHAGRDTGGSQFFLTHLPTPHLDKDVAVPAGRDAHTVFGRVVEGMDVVLALKQNDAISSAKVLNKRNHEYKPETTPEGQTPEPKN